MGIYLVRDLSNRIASIVRPMQALGSGDLTAEVMRRGENTEIGAMADALQVFKDALIAKKAADAAAARDAEAKIERGRRVDSITSNFEAMIGEIVDTVSSASTELEASAGTLTSTAERARNLQPPSPLHRRRRPPMCSGGIRHRGNGVLGQRDQPAGAGIRADGERCRRSGRKDQRSGG